MALLFKQNLISHQTQRKNNGSGLSRSQQRNRIKETWDRRTNKLSWQIHRQALQWIHSTFDLALLPDWCCLSVRPFNLLIPVGGCPHRDPQEVPHITEIFPMAQNTSYCSKIQTHLALQHAIRYKLLNRDRTLPVETQYHFDTRGTAGFLQHSRPFGFHIKARPMVRKNTSESGNVAGGAFHICSTIASV
ncbi:hypothetical protein AOLI_G00259060 [Acnodon oligacanthus]